MPFSCQTSSLSLEPIFSCCLRGLILLSVLFPAYGFRCCFRCSAAFTMAIVSSFMERLLWLHQLAQAKLCYSNPVTIDTHGISGSQWSRFISHSCSMSIVGWLQIHSVLSSFWDGVDEGISMGHGHSCGRGKSRDYGEAYTGSYSSHLTVTQVTFVHILLSRACRMAQSDVHEARCVILPRWGWGKGQDSSTVGHHTASS